MKKLMFQIFRFSIVGIIATLIDYGCYTLLVFVFDVDPIIANIISFACSLPVNFILSMKFVFKAKDGLSKRKQIIIFVISCIIGFIINEGIIILGSHILDYDNNRYLSLLIKILASGISLVWNFVSKKLTLERKENYGKNS